jgi:dihydroneopterin aldolase
MTGLLASVTGPTEALLALDAGADIIDCKQPAQGALGALPEPVIRATIAAVRDRRPVSATVGDLPTHPEELVPAVRNVGATGVHYVKLGLFHSTGIDGLLAALKPLANRYRLIAVLFADRSPRLEIVPELAAAGFAGMMLDTAGKDGRTLLDHADPQSLRRFVDLAHRQGLLCGLAGSLGVEQIAPLAALGPDYLGFRGALCEQGRTSCLSQAACARVRAAFPLHRTHPAVRRNHRIGSLDRV